MKTSSAPRSSSVSPLQERSTSAFSELSAVTMETEKQTKNQTISAQFIENSDARLLGIAVLNKFQLLHESVKQHFQQQELCANSNIKVENKIPV